MFRLKSRESIILLITLIVAVILRFACLDKASGLNYDELVSFKEASMPNFLYLIVYTFKTDVHLPFYPLMLHFWAKIFSFSDYALRAFSAFCGVFTVVTAYFAGKGFKSEKTGVICAGVFAINSFLIYYSQEVRMYALSMLLSTLFLLFLIKIKNDGAKKVNYVWLTLITFLLVNTNTIAFIFVFAQFAAFFTYIAASSSENKKRILKSTAASFFSLLVLCLPLFAYLYINRAHYAEQINGYHCDLSSLFVVVQNWFSPVLTGLDNNPVNYFAQISGFSVFNLIFIFVPIVLSVYLIFRAIKKDKFSIALLAGALVFLASEIIAYKFTNFKILSRYTAIVFPNLLFLAGYGMSRLDWNKGAKTVFISVFFGINLVYLCFWNDAAFRLPRQGFRPLAEIINSSDTQTGDFVVVWNRKEILDKYIDKKYNVLSLLANFAYTSEVMLKNDAMLKKLHTDERKKILRAYFADEKPPMNTIYIMNAVYEHSRPGQKFILTSTRAFDRFDRESFLKIVNDEKKYKEISLNDLLTVKSLLDLKEISPQRFRYVKKIQNGDFVVTVYEK